MVVNGMSADQVEDWLGPPMRNVAGVRYGQRERLTMMSYGEPQATFLLEENKVVLVILVPSPDDDFPSSVSEWRHHFGEPDDVLLSHLGKEARLFLYVRQGLAPTFGQEGQLLTVQFFSPMDSASYVNRYYVKPSAFAK